MRILVSGATVTVGALACRWPDRLGCLLTPANRNSVARLVRTGLPWAADNGAYSGFDPALFRAFLRRIAGRPGCLWLTCPDVVADARATLLWFGEWAPEVRAAGQPVALVGQDGAEDQPIPWADLDAYFIGGSTRWKLSCASGDIAREAKQRGKWLHMGRVNSLRRLRAAWDLGCDSVDGSGYSRFAAVAWSKGRSEMLLARHLRFLDGLDAGQLTMFGLFDQAPLLAEGGFASVLVAAGPLPREV